MAINEGLITSVILGLQETLKTKQAIYEAIIKKGVTQFPVSTKFSEYPKKIELIETNQVSLEMGAKFGYSSWYSIPDTIKSFVENKASTELGGLTNLFTYCQNIQVAELDVKGNLSLDRMFSNCSSLQKVTLTNTGLTKSYASTFYGCGSLTEVSMFINYGQTFTSMFEGCTSLTNPVEAPFNLDNTDCSSMYKDSGIKAIIGSAVIPDDNTITNTSYMFKNCPILTVQNLNLPYCNNMTGMFENDNPVTALLTTVGELTTTYCKVMDSMFRGLSKLTTIKKIDMTECTSATNMFSGCVSISSLTVVNIGNQESLLEVDFSSITNWDSTSLSATIDSCAYRAGASNKCILRFSSLVKSKITAEQTTSLQNKGYTIL